MADAQAFVVPAVLRTARFVPRQAPGRRQPARVTPGAFRAAGLPVPENPAQQNAYQLSRRQGNPWSPGIDRHIGRRGGELLGCGEFILIDIDVPAAVDGTPMASDWIDVCGKPYGVVDFGDTSLNACETSSWSDSSSYLFSTGFSGSDEW